MFACKQENVNFLLSESVKLVTHMKKPLERNKISCRVIVYASLAAKLETVRNMVQELRGKRLHLRMQLSQIRMSRFSSLG